MDDYARRRRQKRQLDALEMDNFGDDPHANLAVSKVKKLPSFTDTEGTVSLWIYIVAIMGFYCTLTGLLLLYYTILYVVRRMSYYCTL